MKKVSIIIPCNKIDLLTEKCIDECLKLNYDDFEILVLPDEPNKIISKKFPKKVKIIETGKIKPAIKRNIGMKKADGGFFAFIDSDAYPKKDWLKNAMKYFEDETIGIVGGPNLTPPEGNFVERVSGLVLSNICVSGHASIRYKKTQNRFVMELPSCNYIVRKAAASDYDSYFLTAEDTKFCFNAREKGFNILYAGDVEVFHHRRETFKKHIKQMFIYGRDNIWLLKKEFSLNKLYFLTTPLGLIGFIMGIILSVFFPLIRNIFVILILFYLLTMFFTSLHKNLKTSFFVFMISITTHFAHAIGSLYGLFSKSEKTEKIIWTSK